MGHIGHAHFVLTCAVGAALGDEMCTVGKKREGGAQAFALGGRLSNFTWNVWGGCFCVIWGGDIIGKKEEENKIRCGIRWPPEGK